MSTVSREMSFCKTIVYHIVKIPPLPSHTPPHFILMHTAVEHSFIMRTVKINVNVMGFRDRGLENDRVTERERE